MRTKKTAEYPLIRRSIMKYNASVLGSNIYIDVQISSVFYYYYYYYLYLNKGQCTQ